MQDEYLTRCVVDTSNRSFNLFSNLGDEKIVECNNPEEFMSVLSFVREAIGDGGELVYAQPL
jgi:hypothetical protein